jgi:predicted ATPase/DNA-binding winged helix-turn-helix (wHTH) protein
MMQENTLAPSPSTSAIERTIAFGPYRLLPRRLALLEAGKPVALGSRALAILIALVERAGELVTKEEIVAQVWPNVFVEEGNLRVHIAALRRALGDGQGGLRYIENIPGRGYRFVAPLDVADAPAVPAEASAALGRLNTLPAPLTRMIGRAAFVDAIVRRVGESRLVTITGPGGIGKSTVAFAAAHELAPSFPDGVIFLDLAPVLDPKLVPSSLTAMVGLAGRSEDPLPGLVRFLKDRRALILLDSCEHVIEAAAQMVDVLSRSLPRLQFLATTREPLGVEGERVFPLAPLDLPAERDRTVSGALASPAVQLFVERATAVLDCFDLTPDNVGFVTEICRRLDGMPLAIEMAAGRVNTLSPAEIASLLDNRFRLLTRGRRTALPRHQTLRATLDWSESLLPPAERLILRRIGIFAGWFTAHGAEAVLPGEGMTLADVVEGIASLVTKSLVAADVSGPVAFYRLLDTTRAYALEKLEEAGERDRIAHLHAGHCFGLFQRASIEWETLPTADWLALYRRSLNDLRAALDWAYSPQGDPQMGVLLAVAAAPLWLELSLMEECRTRMQQALDHLGADDDRLAMRVHSALAWSQMYTTRASQETGAVWRKVLVLAENVEDEDYRSPDGSPPPRAAGVSCPRASSASGWPGRRFTSWASRPSRAA